MRLRGILLILLSMALACGSGWAGTAELSPRLLEAWDDLSETLQDASDLRDRHASLPESAFWGADQESNQKKIAKLLGDARELLLSSEAQDLLKRADQIREKLPEIREAIDGYRMKRISAPEKSRNPFKDTASDYDEKIAEAEARIDRLNGELSEIQVKLLADLRSWGLEISEEQAEVLFSSVVGDDLLKNAVIFQNVKAVTVKLSDLTAANKSDLEMARRYYGMYVVLIDILLDCQERFVTEIDSKWIPQVDAISEGASKSLQEARASLRRSGFTETQKEIFRANAASNELTLEAAKSYRRLLVQQKTGVQKCIEGIRRDRLVAMNTYATVQHVSDLSSVIRMGLQLFDALAEMQLPEIQGFESPGMKREFDEITRRLQR